MAIERRPRTALGWANRFCRTAMDRSAKDGVARLEPGMRLLYAFWEKTPGALQERCLAVVSILGPGETQEAHALCQLRDKTIWTGTLHDGGLPASVWRVRRELEEVLESDGLPRYPTVAFWEHRHLSLLGCAAILRGSLQDARRNMQAARVWLAGQVEILPGVNAARLKATTQEYEAVVAAAVHRFGREARLLGMPRKGVDNWCEGARSAEDLGAWYEAVRGSLLK